MKRETPYETGGFAFADEETMERAEKEAEGVRFVKNSTDMKDPQNVLRVYTQMIDQKIFETPVGYTFLYELQEYLTAIPSISNEDIPAIPIIRSAESDQQSRRTKSKEERVPVTKTRTRIVRQKKIVNVDYKARFRTSFTANIILLLIVLGMFAVTATSGNINILNYENAIIEKYESWEIRLNEREQKLKEREAGLNQQDETTYESDEGNGIIPLQQ